MRIKGEYEIPQVQDPATPATIAKTKLRLYVDAIGHEQAIGLECLAILEVTRAANSCGIKPNFFAVAVRTAASERLLMALARVFDDDSDSITVTSFCCYAEQNPKDCEWVFSEEGIAEVPDPLGQVRKTARKWHKFWTNHALRPKVRLVRDKALAHRDKKMWLGELELDNLTYSEIRATLTSLREMVNDFRYFIDCTHVEDLVYDSVRRDATAMFAAHSAWWHGMIEGSVDKAEFFEWTEQITKALDAQS